MPKTSAVPKPGMAVASLVLGIVACTLSLFVVGALFGLIGLILGLVHVSRKLGSNGLAWWGIGLSIFSILASAAVGIAFYHLVATQATKLRTASDGSFNSWIGVEAPDIAITTLDGTPIRLSQLKGKRVVLDFWATWCGPCVQEMPHFEKLYSESSRDDLIIIGISHEDESTVRSFVAQRGIKYPIAISENLPSPFKDIAAIPTTFFIDRNGIVQSFFVGYRNFSELKDRALTADFQGVSKSASNGRLEIPDRVGSTGSLSSAGPWIGTWKLNPAKSKLQSALAADISEALVICRAVGPDIVELTATQIRTDGSKVVGWKCTVPTGGGMQHYQQGAPDKGVDIVKTVINTHTQHLTYLRQGRQFNLVTIVLSKDGKAYTLSGKYRDAAGRPHEQVEVYEKQ